MVFSDTSFDQLPLDSKRRIDAVCERFERAWRGGQPRLEEFIELVPPAEQGVLVGELLHIEVECRRRNRETPRAEDYLSRLPRWGDVVRVVLADPVTLDDPTLQGNTAPSVFDVAPPPQVPSYEVMGELGRGGMGVVYKARHLALNRLVALKFILTGTKAPPRHQERFRHEAELVAKLRHPHITQIYDIGETGGQMFLALEFAEGGSLRDRLDGHPLEPRAAVLILEPLARAAQHAHRNGIIHRDIKPANVLLAVGGDSLAAGERLPSDFEPVPGLPMGTDLLPPLHTCTPKLTDFGLARLLHDEPQPEVPMAAGTPSYMAPEQAMGEEPGPAVDVWALGATLYELLTGRPPFCAATTADTLRDVLMLEPPPPSKLRPNVPHALDLITMKCLSKDPAQRYAGVRELAQDLRNFLSGAALQAKPAGSVERLMKWSRKRPWLAVLVTGAIFVAVAAVAGLVGALVYSRLR